MANITELPRAKKVLAELRRNGLLNTLHRLAVKALNSIVTFKILRGMHLERAAAAFLACEGNYTAGFLSARALRELARDPATGLSERFVSQALARGDECYAICDGATVAAYGWYSTRPTPIEPAPLALHFAPGYVYTYKAFTDVRYRGQRLHAIGMTRALQRYLAEGATGIVLYVESTNFDSLKSCFRMRCKVFGAVFVIGIGGRYFTFSTPGCKAFDFRLEPAAAGAMVRLEPGKT